MYNMRTHREMHRDIQVRRLRTGPSGTDDFGRGAKIFVQLSTESYVRYLGVPKVGGPKHRQDTVVFNSTYLF